MILHTAASLLVTLLVAQPQPAPTATTATATTATTTTSTTGARMKPYPRALVNFDDFKDLVAEVEGVRAQRLIDFDTFLRMSKEPNTIVLDARSDFRFERKHLVGAKHLSFSDFTADRLRALIPDPNTRVLIYCNNNFDGDPVDFATKMAPRFDAPAPQPRESQILGNRKPVMLALNIPTFINLYGYGYRNVYELDELVNINDPRARFAGTVVGVPQAPAPPTLPPFGRVR